MAQAKCFDCGRDYGSEFGFPDLVVPHDVWARISPTGDGGGLLCPSCICQRLHAAGITTEARFTSGPLAGRRSVLDKSGQWSDVIDARQVLDALTAMQAWHPDEWGSIRPVDARVFMREAGLTVTDDAAEFAR